MKPWRITCSLLASVACFATFTSTVVLSQEVAVPSQAATEKPAERVPENLQITLEKPEAVPTLDELNSGKSFFRLKIKNTGKQPVVIWSHVTATLADGQGQAVDHSWNYGRYGIRFDKKSILEHCSFVGLAPGRTHVIKIKLSDYPDAGFLAGWSLDAPGDYTLQVRYQYDRNAMKKQWGEGCRILEKPTAAWNRALEVDKTVSISFTAK